MEKISFLFYLNWEEQVDIMDNDELRRFIKNLCRDARGEKADLPTRAEQLCWLGIAPALAINKVKYEKRVESNRENGKLGGAPKGNQNAKKVETTQNNPNNLKTVNSKEETVNSKEETVNSKEETVNSKEDIGNREEENDKSEEETGNREKETGKREMAHTGAGTRKLEDNLDDEFTIGNKKQIQFKKPERRTESTMYNLVNRDLIEEYPNWEEDLDNLGPILFTDKYYKSDPGYLNFAENIYSLPKK